MEILGKSCKIEGMKSIEFLIHFHPVQMYIYIYINHLADAFIQATYKWGEQ